MNFLRLVRVGAVSLCGAAGLVGCTGDDGASSDGTLQAEALTPAGVVPPLPGIFDVRAHGAKGDGATDDTNAIQKTIAAAESAGGGVVHVPAGRYLIKGELSVGAAVTLAGEGFHAPSAGAPATLSGSWLIVDATLLDTPAVRLGDGGATMRDMGIWHDQAKPGAGWRPRAFGWAVAMVSPDTLVRNVWLANPTLGIHGTGRVTIENVQGEPIVKGIQIDGAYDVVRIRRVRFNWTADGQPVWSSDPSVKSQLGVGIESLRNDNPEIYDVKVAGYATGIHFGASATGATSKFSMMDTYVDNSPRCITIDGPGTTGKLTRLWAKNCGVTGILLTGANSVVSGADIDIRDVGANGIRVEAPGASFLANQVSIAGWDKGGVGFPAVEAANASASAKVGIFRNLTGGRVPFGGVGQVVVDSSPGSTAFDLRVPTPTEVPEDGAFPFAAHVGVKAHGARGDGTGDDTDAIQAALNAAAAAGGGAVVVPAGDYHLKGSLRVPSGVTLVGIGWKGTPAGKVVKGSYFSIDAANKGDVVDLGDNASIKMIGFRWDQGLVGPGWHPRDFGWAVRVTGTNARARDLFLLNPTKGIEVASHGSGEVIIDHVFGSPQTIGLHLDTTATVRANDLHFWPFWGYGTAASAWVETHGIAFRSDHSAHAEVSNAFSIGYQIGVLLGQNGAGQVSTDFRLWNTDQDIGVRGYVVSGAGTQATFANFSAQGDTSATSPGVTGFWAQPSATNARISGYNGDLRIFAGNALRSDAAGSDIRVNLMRLDTWGRGGPFPAAERVALGPEAWMNGR